MLTTIGAKAGAEDLTSLLLECHHRIRGFSALAEDVGRRVDLPEADVTAACDRCARYFSQALPLHVADEQESLLPRLRGRSAEIDGALLAMHAEHDDHRPHLKALVESLNAVKASPLDGSLRSKLLAIAVPLRAALEKHLAMEERVLFPSIGSALSPEVQAQAVAELRARRKPGPR